MSSVKELEEKVKELMNEIETLKQKQKEKAEKFEYTFKENEPYEVIIEDGRIVTSCWTNHNKDCERYEQGNVFKIKDEAIRERDKRALLTRFRQFRDKCNGGWKPDFEDGNSGKHYISLIHTTNMLKINFAYNLEDFNLFGYFRKESDAKRAIVLFGDEIKRLYLEG